MKVEGYVKRLKEYFCDHGSAIIAYSGGVDSALLAYVAHLALGKRMLAVLADSPSLARSEYGFARRFADEQGFPLRIVQTSEMQNPHYRANQGDRCYYCKKDLFDHLRQLRTLMPNSPQSESWPVFYGLNLDDISDYRPGMKAAQEAGILAPYIDLKIDKTMIRGICVHLGLEIAEKPAMPCMASRIQYGVSVTAEKLAQVEAAEAYLGSLGFSALRVRHHGDVARIEVQPPDFSKLMLNRRRISKKFHTLGFHFVALDLDGFRSGSLNAALNLPDKTVL